MGCPRVSELNRGLQTGEQLALTFIEDYSTPPASEKAATAADTALVFHLNGLVCRDYDIGAGDV